MFRHGEFAEDMGSHGFHIKSKKSCHAKPYTFAKTADDIGPILSWQTTHTHTHEENLTSSLPTRTVRHKPSRGFKGSRS